MVILFAVVQKKILPTADLTLIMLCLFSVSFSNVFKHNAKLSQVQVESFQIPVLRFNNRNLKIQ